MTTINNSEFLFKRAQDKYTLLNKTEAEMVYSVKLIDCDEIEIDIISGTLLTVNSTFEFNLSKDGIYKLYVGNNIFCFSHWLNLRTDLITLIKDTLCSDCGCKPVDCKDKEANDCIKHQGIFTYIQTYVNLIKPFSINEPLEYNDTLFHFYQKTINSNRCFTTNELCKQLLTTCIDGQTHTNKTLFNYFISIYYLGLYYYDINSLYEPSQEDIDYVKKIYHFKCVSKCINKLGLDINIIESEFNLVANTKSPTIGNVILTLEGQLATIDTVSFSYIFIGTEILENYVTYTNTLPDSLVIKSLPIKGKLYITSIQTSPTEEIIYTEVVLNQFISFSNINNLVYIRDSSETNLDLTYTSFLYIVVDAAEYETNIGSCVINFLYVVVPNLPPSELTQINRFTHKDKINIITLPNLLVDYTDPENDEVEKIKILTINSDIIVNLDSNVVAENTEHLPSDLEGISVPGFVLYIGDVVDGDYAVTYGMSDVGSHTYNNSGVINLHVVSPTLDAGLDTTLPTGSTTTTLSATLTNLLNLNITDIVWSLQSSVGNTSSPIFTPINELDTDVSSLENGATYTFLITVTLSNGEIITDVVVINIPEDFIIQYTERAYNHSCYTVDSIVTLTDMFILGGRFNKSITPINRLLDTYVNPLYEASQIIFTSLPVDGVLEYNGVPVIDNTLYSLNTNWDVTGLPVIYLDNYFAYKPNDNSATNDVFKCVIVDTIGNVSPEATITINTILTPIAIVNLLLAGADVTLDLTTNPINTLVINASDAIHSSNKLLDQYIWDIAYSPSQNPSTNLPVQVIFNKLPENVDLYINDGSSDVLVDSLTPYALLGNSFYIKGNAFSNNLDGVIIEYKIINTSLEETKFVQKLFKIIK